MGIAANLSHRKRLQAKLQAEAQARSTGQSRISFTPGERFPPGFSQTGPFIVRVQVRSPDPITC
uniref:Uncharacterized protein n=1 Tax=mine drainage metagenome TaxID=410659 RepID=E6PJM2_9ZZZZ